MIFFPVLSAFCFLLFHERTEPTNRMADIRKLQPTCCDGFIHDDFMISFTLKALIQSESNWITNVSGFSPSIIGGRKGKKSLQDERLIFAFSVMTSVELLKSIFVRRCSVTLYCTNCTYLPLDLLHTDLES